MAIVDVPKKGIRLTSAHEINKYLSRIGIDYGHWEHLDPVSADATDQEILDAYSKEIDELKAKGGYVTADVINVVPIEMEPGDMIRVPRGTLHWFNLCGDRTVRAIRLFQDTSCWTPHYTESGVDVGYEPLC